ncbi:glycoside hydrolase family 31 protein [Dothidotthia symphoricarpi CBS 119687]|uniref:alpha-glucosidase n=1 Tax=Dothidotthia symphoricarpi CBS 119687 TaxID=1392245 RepID=A0A6A6A3Z8_9PLEO|nr:glycoside hydrolase family 31 protein [Dothidotthia symphoricarpi CBS 119687]KAF2125468.1 glycoside hydrolase family 31 protein [Dothidotthia symphoricarpi CBS 119687]
MIVSKPKSAPRWTTSVCLLAALCCVFIPAAAVKHENFKTCDQSGFCKRNRQFADDVIASSTVSPYALDPASITFKDGQLSGVVLKTLADGDKVQLPLTVTFLESGVARVTLDEEKRAKGQIELRHGSKARKERYNETGKWALVGGLRPSTGAALGADAEQGHTNVFYGKGGKQQAIIRHQPFAIEFQKDGETHVKFNEQGLLNMEHWRAKVEKQQEEKKEDGEESKDSEKKIEEKTEDESTWWEEKFGGNTDTKPKGPEAVGLDISFPGYEHVFGIPEHAARLSLKTTRGGDDAFTEPYRLYNADVFEYELDSPMTLYGAIPLMQAHRKGSTVGVFWLNAAETWIDITKTKKSANPFARSKSNTDTHTHWVSESGLLDVFVFLGPTPQDLTRQYGELTGYTAMPQSFAIAYHQCRWNYVSDDDVKDVDRKFDKFNIPFDVIWLDIEYTQEKKYFTWDPLTFDDPIDMLEQLDKHKRKLVTIIDPHIKNTNDYHVIDELKKQDFAVMNKDAEQFEGWCWPGSSMWVDCFNPAAITWWKSLFKYDSFKGTAHNTFIWNDMNEPSVFNGPETTMPKDNLHYENWEHRDVHNLNGMTFHNATYQAMVERKKGELRRPFVLTRSFYSGSQRSAAMWTGDNLSQWSHLGASIPMVLNQGISGFPFAGADVGGFFGNPSKELLTRWYQAGIYYPFFRGHAHIDTRRREPYLAGSPYTEIITQALRLRYQLLPAWYTAFHEASTTGAPIIRPNFYVHPEDERGFAVDDQLYIGSTGLLAKPVTQEGADSVSVYIADEQPYYDYFDYTTYKGAGHHTVQAPLEKIPLLMQGGHVIPRRDRPRRSSGLMKYDPFTLVVVLDNDGNASGSIYLDDGETFDYEQGAFIHRHFSFDGKRNALTSSNLVTAVRSVKCESYLKTMDKVRVEKIIVVGAPSTWKDKEEVIVMEEGTKESKRRKPVPLEYHASQGKKAAWAVIRDPKVGITRGWKIDFGSGSAHVHHGHEH